MAELSSTRIFGKLTVMHDSEVKGELEATSLSGDGSSITNVNASALNNLQSSQFLRNDTSGTLTGNLTVTGHITGDGSDLTNINADTIDGYQAQDFAYPNQPQIANITLTGDFA